MANGKARQAKEIIIPGTTISGAIEDQIIAVVPSSIADESRTIPTAVPSFLQKYGDDRGKGYSHDAEDSIVPLVILLSDPKCQELDRNNAKYVPGAEVGDIILKGAIHPLIKGNQGIVVQPCYFEKNWVEWIPRSKGAGFVTRHDYNKKPKDAREIPDPMNANRTKWVRDNGNELVETRYHYVLCGGQPYVVPFKSTGHTVSKEWTNLIRVLSDGNQIPAFSREYRITTKLKRRMEQSWYMFSIDVVRDEKGDPTYIQSEAQYLAGQAFEKAVSSGQKIAETEEETGETSYEAPF